MSFALVVPTVGRPSLARLLASLADCSGPRPDQVVLVDDRRDPADDLPEPPGWLANRTWTARSGGRGPAAARNIGWHLVRTDWTVFLDDDVLVTASWLADLNDDLTAAAADVAGSQGNIEVPLPSDRPPTDWERGTAGLATASWITADFAYRTSVLHEVGGFDERFHRAFREDADLALRVIDAGHRLDRGRRRSLHPVRPATWRASLVQQRGNADDALMRRLHGADWHERARASKGRRNVHLAITVAGLMSVIALPRRSRLAAGCAVVWAVLTTEFALARILPGPRNRREVVTMMTTSVLIPPLATWHWLSGCIRHRHQPPWKATSRRIEAVLVDRDGTLVRNVPYNGEPALVEPLDGVVDGLARLRAAGLPVAVVTNQSGIAQGRLSPTQVRAVNERIEELLGPFADWQVCPHGDDDGCTCRKPRPGLLLAAADSLGVPVARCAMIGDTRADVQAGLGAGAAYTVLVPNAVTRREEIRSAPQVFDGFLDAVEAILQQVSA